MKSLGAPTFPVIRTNTFVPNSQDLDVQITYRLPRNSKGTTNPPNVSLNSFAANVLSLSLPFRAFLDSFMVVSESAQPPAQITYRGWTVGSWWGDRLPYPLVHSRGETGEERTFPPRELCPKHHGSKGKCV